MHHILNIETFNVLNLINKKINIIENKDHKIKVKKLKEFHLIWFNNVDDIDDKKKKKKFTTFTELEKHFEEMTQKKYNNIYKWKFLNSIFQNCYNDENYDIKNHICEMIKFINPEHNKNIWIFDIFMLIKFMNAVYIESDSNSEFDNDLLCAVKYSNGDILINENTMKIFHKEIKKFHLILWSNILRNKINNLIDIKTVYKHYKKIIKKNIKNMIKKNINFNIK